MKDAPYLHTIVEIEEFTRRAEKLLTAEERGALFDYLSQNPKAGTVIQGTGGVRVIY